MNKKLNEEHYYELKYLHLVYTQNDVAELKARDELQMGLVN